MPRWSIGALLLLVTACSSEPKAQVSREIVLLDGKPVVGHALPGGIDVTFDGDKDLRLSGARGAIAIDARTPAVITAPDDGGVALLSYGDGSGQVYALEAYDLRTLNRVDISAFTDGVYEYAARQPGCRISKDQISYVFAGWLSGRDATIRTEDFSRGLHCEAVNRTWTLRLP